MTKLATRQHMVDVLKSGYIRLIADDNFQAANKKSAAAREFSRLAITSKIAAATVALVTAESLKGSAGADDSHFTVDFIFVLTVVFMLVIPLTIGLLHRRTLWRSMCRSSSPSPSTALAETSTEEHTADKGSQTTLSGYEMQALYEQYVEYDIRLDAYKERDLRPA
eukprot:s4100_g11.t1